jgi:hypothetical protein
MLAELRIDEFSDKAMQKSSTDSPRKKNPKTREAAQPHSTGLILLCNACAWPSFRLAQVSVLHFLQDKAGGLQLHTLATRNIAPSNPIPLWARSSKECTLKSVKYVEFHYIRQAFYQVVPLHVQPRQVRLIRGSPSFLLFFLQHQAGASQLHTLFHSKDCGF